MDFGGDFDESDTSRAGLLDRVRLPFGDALEATARDSWLHNPLSEELDRERLGQLTHDRVFDPVKGWQSIPRTTGLVDPKELNARYGDLGLTFDQPIPQEAADIMVARKREELRLNAAMSRAPDGLGFQTASLLTSLAVGAADPLNIAASFVPVVGEARFALWASRFGRFGARVARGAIEGAVGQAALEPAILANEAAYQGDYGTYDAFLNVVFGTVLGGGLHAGFGALSDVLSRAHPETREGALRSSVAQMAQGRSVDVDAVLRSDPVLRTPEAQSIIDAADKLKGARERVDAARQRIGQAESGIEAARVALKTKALTERTALGTGLDENTMGRLRAVEDELGGTIPAKRRAALTKERDLVRGSIADASPELKTFLESRDAATEATRAAEKEHAAAAREVQDALRAAKETDAKFRDVATKATGEVITADTEAKRVGVDLGSDLHRRAQTQRLAAKTAAAIHADDLASEARGVATQVQAEGDGRARALIEKAKENTLAASRGEIPSTASSPEAAASAERIVRESGDDADDLEADLSEMMNTVAEYEKQGVLTEGEAQSVKDARAAIGEGAKFEKAAKAAGVCLTLHP